MDLVLFATIYTGIVVYIANLQDSTGEENVFLRPALYGMPLVMAMLGFSLLSQTLISAEVLESAGMEPLSFMSGVVAFLVGLVTAGLATAAVMAQDARLIIKRLVGDKNAYDPDSAVHTTAVVLMLVVAGWLLIGFIASGGLEGLAENLADEPPTISEPVFQNMLFVLLALLGTGLYIRRDMPQVLSRLDLRIPTTDDLKMGAGGGIVLFIFQVIAQVVLISFFAPDDLSASEAITQAYSTSPLTVLVLSVSAALGEEMLFRGALQPVFGLVGTSAFFALLHLQYTLTPATLIIFVVGMGFGWLRRQYSTTAAMLAHFVYNFIPLTLLMISGTGAA